MRDSDGAPDVKEIGGQPAGRRTVLSAAVGAGAAMVAAPLIGAGAARAEVADDACAPSSDEYQATGYGTISDTSGFVPVTFTRRELNDDDVLIEILYCGLCHSDVHIVCGDWGPPTYPCVPGHEIVGRVTAVGRSVTKLRPGDYAGVGSYIDSCRDCDSCDDYEEQYCLNNGLVMTYGSTSQGLLYGGFSDRIVVRDRFVMRVPSRADLARTAPLLCAGATTFSPMEHWDLAEGQRVGVVGIGGLGHVAVKLASARGAEVYAFTTTEGKVSDAPRLGAEQGILWTDTAAFEELAGTLDLIISTVPQAYPMQQFVNLLTVNGTMVNLGALDTFEAGISGMVLAMGRRSIAGSMAAGTRETQKVINQCVQRGDYPDVEIISVDQLDEAVERVIAKDVRYRFVVDMSTIG